MKLMICAAVLAFGCMACGTEQQWPSEDEPHLTQGVYDKFIEGDFFALHDVNDRQATMDVFEDIEPQITRLEIHSAYTDQGGAMQIIWINALLENIDVGGYHVQNVAGSSNPLITMNNCQMAEGDYGAYPVADSPVPDIRMQVDQVENGRTFEFTTHTQATEGEQVARSGFLFVP